MRKQMNRRKFIGTSLGAAAGMGLGRSSGDAFAAGAESMSLGENQNVEKEAPKMLYITNCELKGGYPMPAAQWLDIVATGMATVMEYKKQGKVLLHVGFVGRQAGCIIWDVESNDELQRLLAPLPFWPFMEWEIIPGLSTEKILESIKQAQAAVRSAGR